MTGFFDDRKGNVLPETTRYTNEYCKQCGKESPREITVVEYRGTRVTTDYCKICKGFNRVQTYANGRIVQQQYAI